MARALLLALLLAGGCMTKMLRVPVEDHYVQTQTIATSCKVDGWGVGKCTQDDLDAMAEQARCIDAIVKRQTCEPKGEEPAP